MKVKVNVDTAKADREIDVAMKKLQDKIRQATIKLDDAESAYNRQKDHLQKDGLWKDYCARTGADYSHTGSDFR